MKSRYKHAIAAVLGGLFLAAPAADAAITFTAGEGDWTFFYDSVNDSFDVVFRTKSGTEATGLTSPYGTPPGGAGGSANDFNYDSLIVSVTDPGNAKINGINYLITSADDGLYENDDQPDLGIRRRFRELSDPNDPNSAVNQFNSFRLTLDWANSTKPTGAQFALFDGSTLIYETATDKLSNDWTNWGHDHWHWGFSEPGDYELVFTMQGIGGLHGDTAIQTTSLNFSVIPEPSTVVFSLIAAGALGLRRRRA